MHKCNDRHRAISRSCSGTISRFFLALCRARTVGAAARSLGVDTSTVSRRLAALEATLSVRLFDRGREGVVATKAAEDLRVVAEEMEEVMTRFANAADGLEREVSGLVRMTCPPDVAGVVVTPVLPELFAKHPKLRVEIIPGEVVLDLTRREADIALRTVRPARGDLVVTRIAVVPWVLAAAPELARKLGTLRSWAAAPWVTWGERLSSLEPSRWLARHLRIAEPVVISDSMMVQIAAVTSGVGVALLPEPSARHYGLVTVKIGAALRDAAREWPTSDLFLVTHRALRDVPRVRAVWDLLVRRVGGRHASGVS